MNKYPHLFSPLKIKNATFRNRIFAGPCSMTPGSPNLRGPDIFQVMFNEDKARGGAAAVTVSETSVDITYGTRKSAGNAVLVPPDRDAFRWYIKEAAAIERHGAVPSIQLYHPGDKTYPKFIGGRAPVGPNTYTRPDGVEVKAMDIKLMEDTCESFAEASSRLKEYGFKMIMVHGGHGWLFSQFLSPATNRREDEFGGSIENRARFPIMILDAMRKAVGDDFIIEFRMSGDEHMENGITPDDVCAFAMMIEDKVDIIHMSAGSYYTTNQYMFPSIYLPNGPQGCNLHLARAVKQKVKIPVATVGGYYDPEVMDRIIRDGDADIVYMTRQILADPETPNKMRQGRENEITPCVRCMNCLGNFDKGVMGCDVNPNVGHELLDSVVKQPPENKRKVVVVGGGPGGMTAAVTAAQRGHDVTLIEKANKLGGTLNYTEHDCHKKDLMRYRDHLINKVGKLGVDVRLGTEATPETVESMDPFALIVSVGTSVIVPGIPGLLENGALSAEELEENESGVGGEIVIIGGGLTGCETGLHFAEKGKSVTIVEMTDEIASGANHMTHAAILETIERLSGNISIMTKTKCLQVTPEGVEVEYSGGRTLLKADTVIYSVGLKPLDETVLKFLQCDIPLIRPVGDCTGVANLRKAVHGGYYAALDIR